MRGSGWIPLVLLLATFPFGGGCSSSDDAPNGLPGERDQSTLRVYLTDKPAEQYLAVNVTIAAVRVHQSGDAGELAAGWEELPVTAAMPVDLLRLRNGVLFELCRANLPAGHYQQIRLVLAPSAIAPASTFTPPSNKLAPPSLRTPSPVLRSATPAPRILAGMDREICVSVYLRPSI